MKNKVIYIFLILIIFLSFSNVKAVTQAELDTAIKEVMFSYYRTSVDSQYNSAKNHVYAPEEATSQDMKYSVCSRYTYNVLYEGFKVKIPATTAYLVNYAAANKSKSDTVLYYSDCVTDKGDNCKNKSGSTMTATQYNNFIKALKPGDVLVYNNGTSGHALMVYEVYKDTSKTHGCENVSGDCYNARVLNSTGGSRIHSKLDGTNRLYYNNSVSSVYSSNITKDIKEGTIKFLDFRSENRFRFDDYKVNTSKLRTAVLRYLHISDGKLNTTVSGNNYADHTEVNFDTSKAKLRSSYPGIKIEKTVDKIDNGTVLKNDTLTYNIKVTNNSSSNYSKFYIKETITTTAEYTLSNVSGNTSSIGSKTITYTINSLDAGQSIDLKYSVRLKDLNSNIGKDIAVTGKFTNDLSSSTYLSTGTVNNKIVSTLTTEEENSIKNNYSNYSKNYSGAKLINELYKGIIDIDFENFDIKKLIKEDSSAVSSCTGDLKSCSNIMNVSDYKIATSNKYYQNMILNDYWNALVTQSGTPSGKNLFRWASSTRNRNVNFNVLKTGDILVYSNSNDLDCESKNNTYESGNYYYIYINGKFVGVNNKTGSNVSRNVFDSTYYSTGQLHGKISGLSSSEKEFVNSQTLFGKDYYVILRPALLKDVPADVAPTEPENPPSDPEDSTDGIDVNPSSDIHDVSEEDEVIDQYDEYVEIPDTFASVNVIYFGIAFILILSGTIILFKNTNLLDKDN